MQGNTTDTDTLIAIVSSLLEGEPPQPDTILDALVASDGDPKVAATLLDQKRPHALTSKRGTKRPISLTDWLDSPNSSSSKAARSEPDADPRFQQSSGTATEQQLTRNSISRLPLVKLPATASPSKRATTPKGSLSGTRSNPSPVDLLSVLRPPPAPSPRIPRLAPLTLGTPALVKQHTPCTLHLSVLPPELAARLFHAMLDHAREWQRNTWWLFGRAVESPHRTSFFARRTDGVDPDEDWQEAAQFWYNGRATEPPAVFPDAMEEACTYIERVVNDALAERSRFPLEWAGTGEASGRHWHANVAASNCYTGGKESVGFHTDQLTYLGPYPTIASLSLGVTRIFRLREVIPTHERDARSARTFNIPLPHNSLTIMHPPTQETFKHAIPPQRTIDAFHVPPSKPNSSAQSRSSSSIAQTPEIADSAEGSPLIDATTSRINITFRFYRPDFRPNSIPRCVCGVPAVLRADMKGRPSVASGSESQARASGSAVPQGDGSAGVPGTTSEPGDTVQEQKYWWCCTAGSQNEGRTCNLWRELDMRAEGRGPCVGEVEIEAEEERVVAGAPQQSVCRSTTDS